jgi:hypothetical protein
MIEDSQQHSFFTLRFPFKLSEGQQIGGLEELESRFNFTINGLDFTLKNEAPYYVLIGTGFPSEEAARAFIPQLEAGLIWLLIHRGFAAVKGRGSSFLRGVKSTPWLEYADRPIVYSADDSMAFVKIGESTLVQKAPVSDICKFIAEGVSELGNSDLLENSEYRTAVDLYNAFHWETSDTARFLTLVMALEVLSIVKKRRRRESILSMVEKWKEEIKALPEKYEKNSEERQYLETQIASLEGQLSYLMEESITSRIKKLVHDTLEPSSDINESEPVKKAGDIYGIRSNLVHNGHVPPEKLRPALRDARKIVRAVLVAIFQGSSSNA